MKAPSTWAQEFLLTLESALALYTPIKEIPNILSTPTLLSPFHTAGKLPCDEMVVTASDMLKSITG